VLIEQTYLASYENAPRDSFAGAFSTGWIQTERSAQEQRDYVHGDQCAANSPAHAPPTVTPAGSTNSPSVVTAQVDGAGFDSMGLPNRVTRRLP
jgi:hypothetical protein